MEPSPQRRRFELISERETSPRSVLQVESDEYLQQVLHGYSKCLARLSTEMAPPAALSWVPLPTMDVLNARYRRIIKIGEGSFGEVHIIYDVEACTYLTMKRVFRLLHSGGRSLMGLHTTSTRELHLLSTLKHPNLMNLLDYHILENGHLIMIMPLADHDLASLVRSWRRPPAKEAEENASAHVRARMPLPSIKCIMRQLLEAVAYLHRHKVIHRDLKLSNVMLDHRGCVKLLDFGWSRFCSERQGKMTGPPCTLTYRPPELLQGGSASSRYDFALDVWCCGCILFEMLTGGTPFVTANTELEAIGSISDWLGSPSPSSGVFHAQRSSASGGHVRHFSYPKGKRSTFVARCEGMHIDMENIIFVQEMLQLEPSKRPRAEELLQHRWFGQAPAACAPEEMPLPTSNRYRWLESRRKRAAMRA